MTAKETFEKHCPDLHEDTDHVVIENIIIAMEEYKDTEIKEAREALQEIKDMEAICDPKYGDIWRICNRVLNPEQSNQEDK